MADLNSVTTAQLVAVPFPGRGHINPMINFCKLLAIKRPDIIITLVVTEEWHGFLITEDMPHNINFGTIPNVLPSELVRAADFSGFCEATLTKMEEPVEQLIEQLDLRPVLIIYDLFVMWIPGVGGFWSHCGWNSTKEGVFAGLTLPILSGQFTNSKMVVEDWKIGWRVKRPTAVETLVTRVEIATLVKGFMDFPRNEDKC
ncbi:hypothetical protein POM88_008535 [Heracleum sosnowskyi]|uniref:Uncharacterized protein n=1 Tax=Heracleum sosnowskyi TaxID=360622 RepID=A0AAD8N7D4_9APIA|nr:hypothetical protein POM88_008535 [Heracleum sosnowskyi]